MVTSLSWLICMDMRYSLLRERSGRGRRSAAEYKIGPVVYRGSVGPGERRRSCMPSVSEWKVPAAQQPKAEDYGYDLDQALSSVVGLRTIIPGDAFSAQTLGTERTGNGVLIRSNGLVLTIGYLITEAETIWLHLIDGRTVPGHALAYDQATGFGLVQALAKVDLPALPIGQSSAAQLGERVVVGGAGGRQRSVAARIVGKQEFAGYWEYVVDEAIFTAPAHPNWGGTGVINTAGELIGIGSLQLEQAREGGQNQHLNMIVPIDLLKPILDDLLTIGRPNRPPRPWLGLYATEVEDKVVIVGLADNGPAQKSKLKTGDLVISVAGTEVSNLAGLFRSIWAQGEAGTEVPLLIYRDGKTFEVKVPSADRNRFLKRPSMH
jgi:S1-C subfamily serine protease